MSLSPHRHRCCFLLEGNLSYHCAYRFPNAARGYLLSPLSFSVFTLCVSSLALCPQNLCVVFHTLYVALVALDASELLPPPTNCVWMGRCSESVCLFSRAKTLELQPCGYHSRGEALFPRASGRRVHVVAGFVLHDPAGNVLWLIKPTSSRLLLVARLRLLTPAAAAFADQAPRGLRVPLDQFRLLLIDRSANSVESFLSSRNWIWRLLANTVATSRCCLISSLILRLFSSSLTMNPVSNFICRFSLSTHLDLNVEAVMPCWHFRRRLTLPTHLELRLEGSCRNSLLH